MEKIINIAQQGLLIVLRVLGHLSIRATSEGLMGAAGKFSAPFTLKIKCLLECLHFYFLTISLCKNNGNSLLITVCHTISSSAFCWCKAPFLSAAAKGKDYFLCENDDFVVLMIILLLSVEEHFISQNSWPLSNFQRNVAWPLRGQFLLTCDMRKQILVSFQMLPFKKVNQNQEENAKPSKHCLGFYPCFSCLHVSPSLCFLLFPLLSLFHLFFFFFTACKYRLFLLLPLEYVLCS